MWVPRNGLCIVVLCLMWVGQRMGLRVEDHFLPLDEEEIISYRRSK